MNNGLRLAIQTTESFELLTHLINRYNMNGHQVIELIKQLQARVDKLEVEIVNCREATLKPAKVQEEVKEDAARPRGRPRRNG